MDEEPSVGEAPRDPEELEATATASRAQQSLSYYRATVGLEPLEQSEGSVSLGRGRHALLVLVEEPGAGAGRHGQRARRTR